MCVMSVFYKLSGIYLPNCTASKAGKSRMFYVRTLYFVESTLSCA